jgi:hypothetical protein
VDEKHCLSAEVPADMPTGPVEILIVLPGLPEDEAGRDWERGVAAEWADELADPRQDIYTLDDGEPIDDAR